jgi:hypothetical protein
VEDVPGELPRIVGYVEAEAGDEGAAAEDIEVQTDDQA